ncbi:MAG: hypothetical protein GEV03_01265 [Streptosporangiales bacterium]|nr:hypothetical protein [Streptosporangiales bacterium]
MASFLRNAVRGGLVTVERARRALVDLDDSALQRSPHPPLLGRVWELRDNLSAYDAAYVALAELLDVPLLSADGKLARSSGPRCPIELFQ